VIEGTATCIIAAPLLEEEDADDEGEDEDERLAGVVVVWFPAPLDVSLVEEDPAEDDGTDDPPPEVGVVNPVLAGVLEPGSVDNSVLERSDVGKESVGTCVSERPSVSESKGPVVSSVVSWARTERARKNGTKTR